MTIKKKILFPFEKINFDYKNLNVVIYEREKRQRETIKTDILKKNETDEIPSTDPFFSPTRRLISQGKSLQEKVFLISLLRRNLMKKVEASQSIQTLLFCRALTRLEFQATSLFSRDGKINTGNSKS